MTEHDAIRIAREASDNITGKYMPGDDDCLIVCPLLTAGALANPNYKHGGVECLRGRCEFYSQITLHDGECAIYRMADCIYQLYRYADSNNARKR